MHKKAGAVTAALLAAASVVTTPSWAQPENWTAGLIGGRWFLSFKDDLSAVYITPSGSKPSDTHLHRGWFRTEFHERNLSERTSLFGTSFSSTSRLDLLDVNCTDYKTNMIMEIDFSDNNLTGQFSAPYFPSVVRWDKPTAESPIGRAVQLFCEFEAAAEAADQTTTINH